MESPQDSKKGNVQLNDGLNLTPKYVSLFKTEMCRYFARDGVCKFGDKCHFAHGLEELRPVKRHTKYKTERCRLFHERGVCPFGPRCWFIHDEDPMGNVPLESLDTEEQDENLQNEDLSNEEARTSYASSKGLRETNSAPNSRPIRQAHSDPLHATVQHMDDDERDFSMLRIPSPASHGLWSSHSDNFDLMVAWEDRVNVQEQQQEGQEGFESKSDVSFHPLQSPLATLSWDPKSTIWGTNVGEQEKLNSKDKRGSEVVIGPATASLFPPESKSRQSLFDNAKFRNYAPSSSLFQVKP